VQQTLHHATTTCTQTTFAMQPRHAPRSWIMGWHVTVS
jgi:hypothetical protein